MVWKRLVNEKIDEAAGRCFFLPLLFLLAAVTVLYLPVTGFEFLAYDDNLHVYDNQLVTDFSLSSLERIWRAPYEGLYIPLTYTVWGSLARLATLLGGRAAPGLWPLPFHLASLLLHLGAVALVFTLLRRWRGGIWGALVGALFFAWHPVQVESVAWISELKGMLSGFFSLLTLSLYDSYCAANGGRARRLFFYVLATLAMLAALVSKPMAVVVPLLAMVMGVLLLQRPFFRTLGEVIPWMLLAIPVVILTSGAQAADQHLFLPSPWERFLIAGDALNFYIGKIIWPLHLGIDYGRSPLTVLAREWVVLSLWPFLAIGAVFWQVESGRLKAGIACWSAALLPVHGFVTFSFQALSTVADRYLYLAMLGPAVVLCWLFERYRNGLLRSAILLVLVLLAVQSSLQLRSWRNDELLNHHALRINPSSWLSFHNLGYSAAAKGQTRAAISYYAQSLDLQPANALVYYDLGNLFRQLKRPHEAIAAYATALEIKPNYPEAYNNLGLVYAENDQYDQAMSAFQDGLEVAPDSLAISTNIQLLRSAVVAEIEKLRRGAGQQKPETADLRRMGRLYLVLGDNRSAISSFEAALLLNPDLSKVNYTLGRLYCELNRYEEAKKYFLLADKKFDEAQAYNEIGLTCRDLGRFADAVTFYRRAVSIRPDFAGAYANLGMALRELGRIDAAIEAFHKAIDLNPAITGFYLNLAYLYAAQGKDERALRLYRRAAEKSPNHRALCPGKASSGT